ncbi:MAG: hypothetical protein ACFFGP_05040 [Promethearchaeota archaeon]
MNIFNRLVVILLILTIMILIPLILVFPEAVEGRLEYGAALIRANLDWLNSLSPTGQVGVRLALAAAGMLVFLIGLLFLVLEFVRFRRSTVRLRNGSGELMMNGVAGYLAYYIDLLPDVLRVKPTVRSKGRSIQTVLYVETSPGINVLEKSGAVRETARQVLEDELGLQVSGEIEVVIKPVPYPKAPRSTERSVPSKRQSVEENKPEDRVPPFEVAGPPQEEQGNRTIEVKGPSG